MAILDWVIIVSKSKKNLFFLKHKIVLNSLWISLEYIFSGVKILPKGQFNFYYKQYNLSAAAF